MVYNMMRRCSTSNVHPVDVRNMDESDSNMKEKSCGEIFPTIIIIYLINLLSILIRILNAIPSFVCSRGRELARPIRL
jgi:hypothetical protein